VALRDGVIPTIPLRALIPKGSRNIIAVGRCLSSDRIANSGLRVQVPCMATGQAGGIAAALAAKSGSAVGDVPFEMIKEELCRQGCIVP
ncbi:MAG: FAD-dependent oxidoreductase, partial [Clostridia bacterium]|nr:FAD-dependent oxidoreductase [Clostridia bacterium]